MGSGGELERGFPRRSYEASEFISRARPASEAQYQLRSQLPQHPKQEWDEAESLFAKEARWALNVTPEEMRREAIRWGFIRLDQDSVQRREAAVLEAVPGSRGERALVARV